MDLLSQRITTIRNGQKASRRVVVCRLIGPKGASTFKSGHFKLLTSSLEVLRREGYVRAYTFSTIKESPKIKKEVVSRNALYLAIYLKYDTFGDGVIRSISRPSTPARRVFRPSRSLWQPQTTAGVSVISTSRGIMTDIEARMLNLGGELLFGVT